MLLGYGSVILYLAAWIFASMWIQSLRWLSIFAAVAFGGAVQAQSSDSGLATTTPAATTTRDASPATVSKAGPGSASPSPGSCPTGTGQIPFASYEQEYVLVCSVDYSGNHKGAYNAGSIAYCIRTCENVNEVYPNAPCVKITYTPTYVYGYSCHVKYKFGTQQSETYEVDTTILLKGVFYVSVLPRQLRQAPPPLARAQQQRMMGVLRERNMLPTFASK